MRNLLRRTIAAPLLVVTMLAAPASADKTFNIGSLVLPTSATYQTDCGALAVYGLVYNVLRANAWLAAQGPAVAPGGAIQIYYSYKDPKASPNRCAPTNASTTPAPAGDARWTDGCDFSITNPGLTPVTEVKNSATAIGNDIPIVTFSTTGKPNVSPQYGTETIANPTVTTVRYMGGPFVIDDLDAPTFLRLLDGSLIAQDSQGNNIDFAPFRPTGTPTPGQPSACTFGTDIGGYVRVHRARTVFTAPAAKAFSDAPPRLALLATGGPANLNYSDIRLKRTSGNGAYVSGGVIRFTTNGDHSFAVGDVIYVYNVVDSFYTNTYTVGPGSTADTIVTTTASAAHPTSGSPNGMGGGARAVLAPGARKVGTTMSFRTSVSHGFAVGDTVQVAGVNVGPYNGTWTVATVPTSFTFTVNSGSATAVAIATDGGTVQRTSGAATKRVDDGILQKYLSLAGLEFPGARGCPPGGANITSTTLCPLGGTHGQIYDTFDFSDFNTGKLDSSYKMVWTPHWETTADSSNPPSLSEQSTISAISTFLDGQTGLMAECHSISAFEGGYDGWTPEVRTFAAGQFQTCKDNGSGGCDATFSAFGINKNPGLSLGNNNYYPNCTDPNVVASGACMLYGAPADPFVQIGDFRWYTQSGAIDHYLPNANLPPSIYRPGTAKLVTGSFGSLARSDYVTRNNKESNPAKGNILYMAGHDVSGSVSGTKVILQTLLLLGEAPPTSVTKEVTRSSPVATTLSGPAIVQGTFEKVDPPATTRTFAANADASTFRFPDLIGHVRGYDPTTIVGQLDLDDASLTIMFDAANQIPPTASSYAGCATNFTKDCRTIFTHTANGINPTPVVLNASSAATLLPYLSLTATPAAIDATGAGNLIQKVIAGYEASAGVFEARLGGVDRSTVAVVPQSLVAGGARPKMIYFGATDGMLHAVCGEISGPCDALGRELWAFVPKYQLPNLRLNTARVDGSPRVMDMFGDFTSSGAGARQFRTILVFQTTAGEAGTPGTEPSMVALDITNPSAPKIVFETQLIGQGLMVNAGRVRIGGAYKNIAFAQTNNGSVISGNTVTAYDLETGTQAWQHTYPFTTALRTGGTSIPPVTGIPGGAVGVDREQTGSLSDVMFATLYGDIWQLDAATGVSKNSGNPLFRFKTDKHPFGAPPTIYSSAGQPYSLSVSGGYADLAATTLWSDPAGQKGISVKVGTGPIGSILDETSTTGAGQPLNWTIDLQSGDKSYAQATVVGGEVLITTDSSDVNANGLTGYGSSGTDTGHLYVRSVADGTGTTVVDMRGGAGSVATLGVPAVGTTDVYGLSKDKADHLTVTTTAGESLGSPNTAKVTRMLWLRTL